MNFEAVDPRYMHAYWPTVSRGLQEIKTRQREQWIIEDVYAAIVNRQSVLHIAFGDGENGIEMLAFMVCSLSVMPYTGEPIMFIWCAWCKDPGMFEECDRYVMDMAKRAGVHKVRMESKRHGWERRGWDEVTTIYERDVI